MTVLQRTGEYRWDADLVVEGLRSPEDHLAWSTINATVYGKSGWVLYRDSVVPEDPGGHEDIAVVYSELGIPDGMVSVGDRLRILNMTDDGLGGFMGLRSHRDIYILDIYPEKIRIPVRVD
jgi:hypothetical protein